MSRRGSICNVPCGVGYSLGGLGSCGPVPVYGGGLDCGPVACSVQLSGSEVMIQPPPSVVTIPGPIVSASPDPVAVGQTTPSYGYGYPALGSAGGLSGGYQALGSVGGLYGGNRRLGYGGGYGGRYGFGYCGGYGSGYGRRYSQRCLPYYWFDTCGPC